MAYKFVRERLEDELSKFMEGGTREIVAEIEYEDGKRTVEFFFNPWLAAKTFWKDSYREKKLPPGIKTIKAYKLEMALKHDRDGSSQEMTVTWTLSPFNLDEIDVPAFLKFAAYFEGQKKEIMRQLGMESSKVKYKFE